MRCVSLPHRVRVLRSSQFAILCCPCVQLTNGDGLDAHTLFKMGICSIIGIFPLQDFLSTECIDKGSSTWKEALGSNCAELVVRPEVRTSARCSADHQAELNTLLDIFLSANLDLRHLSQHVESRVSSSVSCGCCENGRNKFLGHKRRRLRHVPR